MKKLYILVWILLCFQIGVNAEEAFYFDNSLRWDSTIEEVSEYLGNNVMRVEDGDLIILQKDFLECFGLKCRHMMATFEQQKLKSIGCTFTAKDLNNREYAIVDYLASCFGEPKMVVYSLEEYILTIGADRTILGNWDLEDGTSIEVYRENKNDEYGWLCIVQITNMAD